MLYFVLLEIIGGSELPVPVKLLISPLVMVALISGCKFELSLVKLFSIMHLELT